MEAIILTENRKAILLDALEMELDNLKAFNFDNGGSNRQIQDKIKEIESMLAIVSPEFYGDE